MKHGGDNEVGNLVVIDCIMDQHSTANSNSSVQKLRLGALISSVR